MFLRRLFKCLLASLAGLCCALDALGQDVKTDFSFEAAMPRPVLNRYLSRAVTHAGLCASFPGRSSDSVDDDIRMLVDIGAKFVGRAAFVWDLPPSDTKHFERTRANASKVHAADAEIILQACVFEAVFPQVNRIVVPHWVLEAYDLPIEKRTFNYQAMTYRDGARVGQWRGVGSVPDMSRTETQLWFYYRACRYIACGMEAIHFGQVKLMDNADPGHKHWLKLLSKVREYARKHARRQFVLCDAHTHGEVEEGRLLFDFHSYPLRIQERKGKPQEAILEKHGAGKIYGKSKGGVTPSGWECQSLPYLVEFDNWGFSGKAGQSVGGIWVWGYDEMSWFGHQTRGYQASWLAYADGWLKHHAPQGHLQMPTRRKLAAPVDGRIKMFQANAPSEACPDGFGLESAIKALWNPKSKD